MADVKHLFLGGLKLRNMLLILAGVIAAGLFVWRRNIRELLTKAYKHAAAVFAVAVVVLGIGFMADFTTCFTIFHEIFFTNDLWLFDPATDYMIRMLPEGFFFSMVFRILQYFILSQILISAVLLVWDRAAKKQAGPKKQAGTDHS